MRLAREFKLPDLGEGVAEGEIVKWLVSEGDDIAEDQPMVEVMTDKATVQIPSPTTGKVKQILTKEGQAVKVGTTIVVLDAEGKLEGVPQMEAERAKQVPAAALSQMISGQPGRKAVTEPSRIIATPATRKLARELDVNIESIRGSGPGGRITEDDIRAVTKSRQPGQVSVSAPEQLPPVQEKAEEPFAGSHVAFPQAAIAEREQRLPLHGIRKRIAEKMAASSRSTAHVTHVDEVDFTELISLREKLKPFAEEKKTKLTFLPFIMKAAVSALRQFQYFNSSIDEVKQEIVLKKYYNIGFATDTSNGLIVPVVKDVETKSILEIAGEIEELATKAREGKISLDEIQGGTFTITNIGTLGGIISTPIINVPEVAILGVHKIQKRPVVRENQIVIRDVANVALTFDHRIVDGADAARFTSRIIQILENPGLFILDDVRFQ